MRHIFSVIETNAPTANAQATLAPEEHVSAVQDQWGDALRCEFGRAREVLLCKLAESTQDLVDSYPNDAKVQLWHGVVLTGYAKCLGGLAGLQLLKQAKVALDQAIALAPQDGAAYLYLGLLYDSVPEAPYGFGDETLAKALLEQGLALTLNSATAEKQRTA